MAGKRQEGWVCLRPTPVEDEAVVRRRQATDEVPVHGVSVWCVAWVFVYVWWGVQCACAA